MVTGSTDMTGEEQIDVSTASGNTSIVHDIN